MYDDLVAALPEDGLLLDLPALPSNAIGAQLWCVAGARESYVRGIRAGAWQGFTCGLSAADTKRRDRVGTHLERTESLARECLDDPDIEWTAERERLLVDLLTHEAQHHGQLIRYLYANRLRIPDSWKARYALD